MKIIALFLLVMCIWDLIAPFRNINKSRKEAGVSWIKLLKFRAFYRYSISFIVNILGIVFFSIYLF